MAADSYDVTIDQGADWFWTVRWLVGKNQRSAVPKDVTGYTGILVIATDYNAVTPLLSLDATLVVDSAAFGFHATAVQTDALPAGQKLVYEVRAVSPDSVVKRLAYGRVRVNPSVT